MRKLFFDIETRNTFQEVGKADPTALDISVVCAYDSETETYSSYTQEDLHKLWPLIEQSDVLVTFNGDHFDIPLLNKYYSGNLMQKKSLDLLKEVKKSLGFRVGLGVIAQGTLNAGKSAHGLEAVEWWKKGEIDKIIKYCLDDVKITKEVHDYAIANKKLKYKEGEAIIEFPMDTKEWEDTGENKMNFTLPF
jgi:DEAD/DEAH box helicase domain-containing protein